MRLTFDRRLFVGCLSVGLMAGCQVVPAPGAIPTRASFALGVGGVPGVATEIAAQAIHSGTLTVDFGRALGLRGTEQRRVLATLADVERVVVTVKTADNAIVSQTVERATITAGQTTLTFNTLAPGAVTVTVEAKDSQNQVIGSSTQSSTVTAGATSTIDVLVSLAPSLTPVAAGGGASSPTTGQLTTNVTFQDGLVGIGPIAPGDMPIDLEIDGDGNVWTLTTRLTDFRTIVKKFDADGQFLASFLMPTNEQYFLDSGPDGHIYGTSLGAGACFVIDENGQDVSGAKLEFFKDKNGQDVSGSMSSYFLETNPAFDDDGNIVFGYFQEKALCTCKPDGTIISKVALPIVGDLLRRDPTGGYWITSTDLAGDGARIVKVSASGTVVGNAPMPDYAIDLEVDSSGNAWVWDGTRISRFALTDDVTMTQPIAEGGRLGLDGSGHLWVRARTSIDRYDNSGTMVTSYAVPGSDDGLYSVVRFDAQGHAWVTGVNGGAVIRLTLP